MIGGASHVPLPELRSVVAHVRALEAEAIRTSRARYWTYALFLAILAGSLRAAPVCAYLTHPDCGVVSAWGLKSLEESRMRSVNLGVVSSLLVAATATSQNAVQWRPSTGGNGHWYVGVGVAASGSWEDASAAATALGAHLATFTTEAEFSWVVSGPASPPAIWNGVRGPYLGGVQGVGGTLKGWGWVTGEPWLPLWGPGNCGADDYCDANALTLGRCNSLTAIGYNDWPRTNSACVAYEIVGAVFEWSADCNADGVVDYGQIRAGLLADLDGDWIPDCCESGQPCPPDAREWSVSDGGNGHWYRAVAIPSGTSWTEARALAE